MKLAITPLVATGKRSLQAVYPACMVKATNKIRAASLRVTASRDLILLSAGTLINRYFTAIGPIRYRFFVYELVQIILRIRRVKIMV